RRLGRTLARPRALGKAVRLRRHERSAAKNGRKTNPVCRGRLYRGIVGRARLRTLVQSPSPSLTCVVVSDMEQPERKRRGPLTWLAGRSRRFWIITAIALPLLYVLGSGPTRSLAIRQRYTYTTPPGASTPALYATREYSAWWTITFAPM